MKKPSLLIVLFLVFAVSLNAQTPLDKGNTAYKARNFSEATLHFGRAIMDNPGNSDLQMKLANCLRFLNKMNEAEKRYEIVCKNPNTAPINYYHYGTVLQANKKYDQAIVAFGKYAKENKARALQAQEACAFAKKELTRSSAFIVKKETGVSHVSFDDYNPFLHKGKLYFSSARTITLASGSSGSTDNYLYEASKNAGGQLSGLKIVKNPIEITPQNNTAPLAINSTETVAVTSFNQFANGTRHLYESAFIGVGMELSTSVEGLKNINYIPMGKAFPHVGENHAASFPHIANSGRTIYFAAYNLPGGYGGFDIWVIHQQGNDWTRPQNLGPNINSSGDEVSPFVSSDGYLFFASNHHKGFGGFDIFRAKRSAGVWRNIRNLGNKVNSSYDDLYFVFDAAKRTGYFASNRDGYLDIYNGLMNASQDLMPLINEKEKEIPVTTPVVVVNNNNNNNTTTPIRTTNTNQGGTVPNNSTVTGTTGSVTQTQTGGYRPTTTGSTTTGNTTTYPIDGYNNPVTNPTPIITNTPIATTNVGSKPTVSPTGNGTTVPCSMNFYIGAIIDQETKRPVKDATVYIKNLRTGEESKIKDPTNHYGEYSVILDPLHDYTIAISKAGFKNLVFDVNTGNGGKKTLLGTRPMLASPMLERDKYGTVIDADAPISSVDRPSDNDLINPIKSTGKTFSYDANGAPIPSKGYLIQALVASNLTASERLELEQYGNIVTEARGDKKAYRVGIFADEAHANKSLAEVRKTYKDAFKVPVQLDNNHLGGRIALSSQVIYPLPAQKPLPVLDDMPVNNNFNQPRPTVIEQPTIKERELNTWTNNQLPDGLNARGTGLPSDAVVAFKVQLGAFKDASTISFSNVSYLGLIEKQKRSNGLTYVYISSFKTLDEARIARAKAKEKGVESPFIVAFKNGVRVNISDVVNN